MDPRVSDDRIPLVRNDTGPQIRLELTDTSTGQRINLSGATALLYFRAVGTTQVLVTRPLVIPGSTATDGIALIVWEEGDLDHPGGSYEGEVEVLLQNGIRQTVFEPVKFRLREDF
jgi:hypothetical protein